MAYGTPTGQPLKPRRWNDPGDGSVCLVAKGPAEAVVRGQVQHACVDLGLPLGVCGPRDIETVLRASILMLYGDVGRVNDDNHDNDADHENVGWPYLFAVRAQASRIPIIALHRSDALDDEIDAVRSLAGSNVIPFGAAPIVEELRKAIARNFVRVQVTYLAEKKGWGKGIHAQVLDAFTNKTFQVPLHPHSPGDRAWIQRSRELVADYQAQVARASQLAEDIISRAGYTRLSIPLRDIVKSHGLGINLVHLAGLSGRIKITGKIGYIDVNKDEPVTRQNFTIAHEFGHRFLGHAQDCFRSASRDGVLRPEEDAADAFAASLLMPAPLLTREFERLKALGHAYDAIVRDMARTCHVGESAMRLRLRYAGLV